MQRLLYVSRKLEVQCRPRLYCCLVQGFGFVNYESPEHAAEAVDQLNGHKHDDKEWEVSRAQKKSEREAELKAKYERVSALATTPCCQMIT